MGEYSLLIKLGLGAVVAIIVGILLRMFGIKYTHKATGNKEGKGKAKAKGVKARRKKSKETFYQDGDEKVPDDEGEVLRDDNLFNLKEKQERGTYTGDKEVEDDGKYESWDKY